MTISYTYQYQFFPKHWKSPSLIIDDEQENLTTTIENRRIISAFIKDWLNVLNTWRFCIKYGIIPILILALAMSIIGWLTFLILLLIVLLISLLIWARTRAFHSTIAVIEIVIDEVIAANLGFKPPKILERE